MNHYIRVDYANIACFKGSNEGSYGFAGELREGWPDPGGYLVQCGAVIKALAQEIEKAEQTSENWIAEGRRAQETEAEFRKLQKSVQTEAQKALIVRCGELEAEAALLRARARHPDIIHIEALEIQRCCDKVEIETLQKLTQELRKKIRELGGEA